MFVVDLPPGIPQEAAVCAMQAGERYVVPPRILLGIRHAESRGKSVVSANRNGTFDYGPYQINTFWSRKFEADYGIRPHHLMQECTGANAAAFVLRYELNRSGDLWKGVGRYHSPNDRVRAERYALLVYNGMRRIGLL